MENVHTNSMNRINKDTDSPIKKILYEYINKNESYLKKLIVKNNELIVTKIINHCYDSIININENTCENVGNFIESMLHYLFTMYATPTQRKIISRDIYIDIVIPNIQELINNPKNSLLIYIPKTKSINEIKNNLRSLNKLQPISSNIWFISDGIFHHDFTQYSIKINNSSINTIIHLLKNVQEFIKNQNYNTFKIINS